MGCIFKGRGRWAYSIERRGGIVRTKTRYGHAKRMSRHLAAMRGQFATLYAARMTSRASTYGLKGRVKVIECTNVPYHERLPSKVSIFETNNESHYRETGKHIVTNNPFRFYGNRIKVPWVVPFVGKHIGGERKKNGRKSNGLYKPCGGYRQDIG